jgi:hypothetical protein
LANYLEREMANKTIRFITAWNGYKDGDIATFLEAESDALIAGRLARDASENDNTFVTDLQGQINTHEAAINGISTVLGVVGGLVTQSADEYADDAAAALGGVAVGDMYSVAGVVHVRVA